MEPVASQLMEEVTAHAQSDSLEDAQEICANGSYFPNNLRIYVCTHACMYVYMYVHMHVCTYVCMHACIYVCMHVCIYVCMYACIFFYYIYWHAPLHYT